MPTPRLLIDFVTGDHDSFVIEELTFNPYISEASISGEAPIDIWMEFSVRRIGSAQSSVPAPHIRLRIFGDDDHGFQPTTGIPKHISGIENAGDMNFMMFSDIWYSFVRLNGRDREFMEYGYRNPRRLIPGKGPTDDPLITTIPPESWITGSHLGFRQGRYQQEADALRMRILRFHQLLLPFEQKQNTEWLRERPAPHQSTNERWIPVDRELFAPVYFEAVDEPLKGRFAVKREPWVYDALSRDNYGIGYGGTVEIQPMAPNEFLLEPRVFCEKSSKPVPIALEAGEIVRFWLHFQSQGCLRKERERIAFAFQIEFTPKVETFNAFFRFPEGFEPIPGGLTELRHYATPPRLFFIWDQFHPEQCFSYTRSVQTANGRIELNPALKSRKAETDRVINIFIFGVFIGVLGNLCVGTILTHPLPKWVEWMKLQITDIVALLLVVIPVIRVYLGYPVRMYFVFVGLCLILAIRVPFALNLICGIGAILLTLCMWLLALDLPITRLVLDGEAVKTLLPSTVMRVVRRRRYLKKLKATTS